MIGLEPLRPDCHFSIPRRFSAGVVGANPISNCSGPKLISPLYSGAEWMDIGLWSNRVN